MNDSHIVVNADGTPVCFVGPDATDLFRVRVIRASILMHKQCGIIPTRGVTITRLFQIASGYTGKPYKRGQHDQALADLDRHLAAFTASMPIVER